MTAAISLESRDDTAKINISSYYSAFLLDFNEVYLSLQIETNSDYLWKSQLVRTLASNSEFLNNSSFDNINARLSATLETDGTAYLASWVIVLVGTHGGCVLLNPKGCLLGYCIVGTHVG